MVTATWRASNYRSPDNASSSIKAFTNTSLASDANARVPPRATTRSVSTAPIRRTSLAPFDADAGRTSRFWSYQARDDGFSLTATHDGFRNLSGSPRHVRRFDVSADRIEIEDRIEGTTDRPASIGFLLHPAVVAEVSGHEARLRLGPLDIILSSSRPIDMEDAVWWPDMGVERQTQRLRIGFPPGAETVTTAIRLSHTTDGFGQNT